MEKKQYWPDVSTIHNGGYRLEARANLALVLMEKFAIVAGTRGPEDSNGRAAYELLSPGEVVERAYALADLFMDRAEERGDVREWDAEESFRRGGELIHMRDEIAHEAAYGRYRKKAEEQIDNTGT